MFPHVNSEHLQYAGLKAMSAAHTCIAKTQRSFTRVGLCALRVGRIHFDAYQ